MLEARLFVSRTGLLWHSGARPFDDNGYQAFAMLPFPFETCMQEESYGR
jgi:hypothetical protein